MNKPWPLRDDGVHQPLEDDLLAVLCSVGRGLRRTDHDDPPCPERSTRRLILTDQGGALVPLCTSHFDWITATLDSSEPEP